MLKKDMEKIHNLIVEWGYNVDWAFVKAIYAIGYNSGYHECLEKE